MAALRKLSAAGSALMRKLRIVMGTVTGIALTYGVYKTVLGGKPPYLKARNEPSSTLASNVQTPPFGAEGSGPRTIPQSAAGNTQPFARSQPCVISHDKAHALFLCIRVKGDANAGQVASSIARLQEYVQQVEAPIVSCGNYHIFAGVGFGPEFYQQVKGGAPQPFSNAKHGLLSGEGVGGDILIHAKSNTLWMLQRLAEVVLENLPKDSIQSHEETYGEHKDAEIVSKHQSPKDSLGVLNYQYSQGDLELLPPNGYRRAKPNLMFVQESGHEDTETKRRDAAVDPHSGGSYVMTQRWVHDVKLVDKDGKVLMNEWIDKAWKECAGPSGEFKFKPLNALGADYANKCTDKWMGQAYQDCLAMQKKHPKKQIVCSPGNFTPQPPTRIVRQSVPFQKAGGEFGLFFISYSSSPRQHELLMDRLVASTCSEDKLNSVCSEVFKLSHNVHDASWYFPGQDELSGLL